MAHKSPEKLVKNLEKHHNDLDTVRSILSSYQNDSETLTEVIVLLLSKSTTAETKLDALNGIHTQMTIEYKKIQESEEAAQKLVKKLRKDYKKLLQNYHLNSRVIFGDRAEDIDRLFEKMSKTFGLDCAGEEGQDNSVDDYAYFRCMLEKQIEQERRRRQQKTEGKREEEKTDGLLKARTGRQL